ncbi:MAG: hypothetical protein ABEL76_11210 [Bradymonadaceae bacterium]
MADLSDEACAERLRTALELFEAGVELRRQQLRRTYPEAGEEEIQVRLREWIQTRPGAEHGDAEGTPIHLSEGEEL